MQVKIGRTQQYLNSLINLTVFKFLDIHNMLIMIIRNRVRLH